MAWKQKINNFTEKPVNSNFNQVFVIHQWYHVDVMSPWYDVMRRALFLCSILFPKSSLVIRKY